MGKFQIFIQLARLNKPIGIFLLFWPCAWGLTLGYFFNNESKSFSSQITPWEKTLVERKKIKKNCRGFITYTFLIIMSFLSSFDTCFV